MKHNVMCYNEYSIFIVFDAAEKKPLSDWAVCYNERETDKLN